MGGVYSDYDFLKVDYLGKFFLKNCNGSPLQFSKEKKGGIIPTFFLGGVFENFGGGSKMT